VERSKTMVRFVVGAIFLAFAVGFVFAMVMSGGSL
jgi:hypothetical protein